MIKNYGVYEGRYESSVAYMSDGDVFTFVPLNTYRLGRIDFTWDNIKFLAIF